LSQVGVAEARITDQSFIPPSRFSDRAGPPSSTTPPAMSSNQRFARRSVMDKPL
jgi:hypothetical protein